MISKEVKIKQLKAKLSVLRERDKDNQGVCRKLERQLRNLEKNRTTKALRKIKKYVAKHVAENEDTRINLEVTKDFKRIDDSIRT